MADDPSEMMLGRGTALFLLCICYCMSLAGTSNQQQHAWHCSSCSCKIQQESGACILPCRPGKQPNARSVVQDMPSKILIYPLHPALKMRISSLETYADVTKEGLSHLGRHVPSRRRQALHAPGYQQGEEPHSLSLCPWLFPALTRQPQGRLSCPSGEP